MTDAKMLHNPYDFANPVLNESLFFGRRSELQEIRYYVDLAKSVPRPINLSILGNRASGKTSLLNMTEQYAKRQGFCTARINLDEGDIQNELRLFFKIFDAILTSVCEEGAFGGLSGKVYDTYVDLISTNCMPTNDPERLFLPFLFPISYAKSMAAGNLDAPLQDYGFTRDLRKISEESHRPILLLFDEANVLAKSRVHLQKLRNIFMNLSHFMLVLTGTPDLFPLMDEVFSPMVRQFKKVILGEFKSDDETRQCVREPLLLMGLSEKQMSDLAPDFGGIHEVSGGRPYEVQLVSHILFRRVQTGRAGKMSLDVAALDEVRQELETSQSLADRPLLRRLRSLNREELSALMYFAFGYGGTFEDMWTVEYFLEGERNWNKKNLNRQLDPLVDREILSCENDTISFRGDEFEKI
jgi:hypothetical protein